MDRKALKEQWAKKPQAEQIEAYGRLLTEQRAILEKAKAESRDLTGDENIEYEGREATVDVLVELKTERENREERERKLSDREKAAEQRTSRGIRPEAGADKGKEKHEQRDRAVTEIAGMPVNFDDLDPEVRASYEARSTEKYGKAFRRFLRRGLSALTPEEQRDLSVGTANQGGYLVPVQDFVPEIVRLLDNQVPIMGMATKFMVAKAQSLGVPTMETNPADGAWTTELDAGNPDTTFAFGKRELTPWPLVKALKVSRKFVRNTPLDIVAFIADRLAYKINIPIDTAYNSGTGANQPLGWATKVGGAGSAGIDTTRDTGLITTSAVDADKLITLRHSIRAAYEKSAKWVFHRTFLAAVRKLKATTGAYLWDPSIGLTGPTPSTLLDFPVVLDEQAPSLTTSGTTNRLCALGDWSYYYAAVALDMDIQRVDELYAATNQIGFFVRAEIDGMPVLSDAFVCGTDA